MPCLTCGVPTRGKPLCPDHAQAKAAQQATRNNQRTHTLTTKQRGYDAAWRKVRALVLANDRQCFWCGGYATTVDHVLPISSHPELRLDLDNLVPACRPCNSARTTASDSMTVVMSPALWKRLAAALWPSGRGRMAWWHRLRSNRPRSGI